MSRKLDQRHRTQRVRRNEDEGLGVGESGANRLEIDKFVTRCMAAWRVPGVAVGIVDRGRIVLAGGYGVGDTSSDESISANTPFLVASCTKSFTATAMAMLVNDGIVEWDTPIRKYTPRFRLYDLVATERTSVRDLLTHRWGLAAHDYIWVTSRRSRSELFNALRHLEPSADFRSRFQYSNLAYLAAAHVLEKKTCISWEDFVAERILRPLGIEPRFATSMQRRHKCGDGLELLPIGYKLEDDSLIEWFRPWGKSVEFADILGPSGPSGSLVLTIADMCRWLQFQMAESADWRPGGLDPSLLRELHRPQIVLPTGWLALGQEFLDAAYGMGWWIQPYRGHRVVAHAGNCCGFSAMMSFMPGEKLGIAVLTNTMTSPLPLAVTFHVYDRLRRLNTASDWVTRLSRPARLERTVEGMPILRGKSATRQKRWRRALAEFAGVYRHPSYGRLRIDAQKNHLVMVYGGFVVNFARCGENEFSDSGQMARLEGEGPVRAVDMVFHEARDERIANLSVRFELQTGAIKFRACGGEDRV